MRPILNSKHNCAFRLINVHFMKKVPIFIQNMEY